MTDLKDKSGSSKIPKSESADLKSAPYHATKVKLGKDKYILKITNLSKLEDSTTEHRILMMDNSGSMNKNTDQKLANGNDECFIDVVKDGMKQLIDVSNEKKMSIRCFTFNTKTNEISTGRQCSEDIKKIEADDQTHFSKAFDTITSQFKTFGKKNYVIVFMTDGEDTNPDDNAIIKAKKAFLEIRDSCNSCTIHCVSLGKCDAQFVSNLTQSGTIQGSLQYCKDGTELKETFDVIRGLLSSQVERLPIVINEKKYVIALEEGTGTIMINSNDIKTFETMIKKIKTNIIIADETDPAVITDLLIESCRTEIITLTSKFINDQKNIDTISAGLKEIEIRFSTINIKDIKSPKLRTEKMTLLLSVKELYNSLLNAIAKAKIKALDASSLAVLGSNSYRHIHEKGKLKAGLQKKLDQRIVDNTERFGEDQKFVESFVNELNADSKRVDSLDSEIKDKYLSEIECYLCLDNLKSCITKGKCLGYAIKCVRPQVAIADPTQFKLLDLYTDIVCNECFHENVVSAQKNDSNASGGFGRDLKTSIKDSPAVDCNGALIAPVISKEKVKSDPKLIMTSSLREQINGMIPVNFTKSHQKLVEKLCKPILGFMVTLDPFGYALQQKIAVYGFAIAHFYKKGKLNDTEELQLKYLTEMYESTLANCKMVKEINDNFKKFISGLNGRTVDVIPNLMLFLTQVKVVRNSEQKKVEQDLTLFVLEEEMRRRITGQKMENDYLQKLFGIDSKVWFAPFEKEVEEKFKTSTTKSLNSNYAEEFMAHLPPKVLEAINKQKSEASKADLKSDMKIKTEKSAYNIIEPEAHDLKLDITEEFKQAKIILQRLYTNRVKETLQILTRFDLKVNDNLYSSDLKLDTTEKQMAFWIQINQHSENADRRFAIEKKTVVNVFDQKECEKFLKEIFTKVIFEGRSAITSRIKGEYVNVSDKDRVAIFSSTTNLFEAAGVLHGYCCVGTNIMKFYDALMRQGTKKPLQKLKLLLNGTAFNVKLLYGKDNKWRPRSLFWFYRVYYDKLLALANESDSDDLKDSARSNIKLDEPDVITFNIPSQKDFKKVPVALSDEDWVNILIMYDYNKDFAPVLIDRWKAQVKFMDR